MTLLCKDLDAMDEVQPGSQEAKEARNALKMYMTIFSWIVMAEEMDSKSAATMIASSQDAPTPKKGAKKGTKAKAKDWDWQRERNRSISVMGQILHLNVQRLWPMSVPEENFVK